MKQLALVTVLFGAILSLPTSQADEAPPDTLDSDAEVPPFEGRPQDQAKNRRRDYELTRLIRARLMKDDSLSKTAKSVNVVTVNGIVFLRGSVGQTFEKDRVASWARSVVGDGHVRDNLTTSQP